MKEQNTSSVNTERSNKTVSTIKRSGSAGEKGFSQDKNKTEQVVNARKGANLAKKKAKAKKKKAMKKASRK